MSISKNTLKVMFEQMSEDEAMQTFHALRSSHGWTGTIFTRADFEASIGADLTDKQWEEVKGSKMWDSTTIDVMAEAFDEHASWIAMHLHLEPASDDVETSPGGYVHKNGVVELPPHHPRATVCGTCGRGWDDAVSTALTPVPAARCPFEYEHAEYDSEYDSEVAAEAAAQEEV